MSIEMFCGSGYHPESDLRIEVTESNRITGKRLVEFKCNQCGKVFSRVVLQNDVTIRHIEEV